MTTIDDLYVYYCRQHNCLPNSGFRNQLRGLYAAADDTRKIAELSLVKNYLGPRGVLPVFDLIRNIHSLQRVDLSGNGLDNDGVSALVEACIRHPSLVQLDLSRSTLHDGCAALLLRLLEQNPRIASLNLAGNNFSASTREKIAHAVSRNRAEADAAANDPRNIADDVNDTSLRGALVPPREAPYRAFLDDSVSVAESGGSLSFEYTWRRNPQFRVAVSKAARARITLTVAEPSLTRLVGFTLLKTSDARKALVTDRDAHFEQRVTHDQPFVPATFVAESNYSETSCCMEVDLGASSCPCDAYVVVPYSFQPGKAFAFRLTVEVPPAILCSVVTLEKVPETDSWLLEEVEGAWTEQTAGGAISAHPSWRLNDMIRVRLDTDRCKAEPGRLQSAATFFVLVSVQNEEATSAAKAVDACAAGAAARLDIGCDVLLPETSECATSPRRPIRGAAPHLAFKHRTATTIAFAFDRRCNEADLDFFLLPSTLASGVQKSYRVAIYSSTYVRAVVSSASADWCWRQLPECAWSTETCGGGRSDNPRTWINNPCYKLVVPSPRPVDALIVLTSPGPAVGGGPFSVASAASVAAALAASKASAFDFTVELDQPDDACTRVHHRTDWTTSATRSGECMLWANNLQPGEYRIVPQTRLPGVFAPFRINLYSTAQLLVEEQPVPLAIVLRAQQLERYNASNVARATRMVADAAGAETPPAAAAAQDNDTAVQFYGASGELFTDRDFPRGPSSVWLNAQERPFIATGRGGADVPDFPDVVDWCRATEMVAAPVLSPLSGGPAAMGVTVQGVDDSWLFSAACAVCVKRSLAAQVVVHADFTVGVFQFRFFKRGVPQLVCVDDYLPVDACGELCFARSAAAGDVFFPLLEKAYAKLHRCYEALDAWGTSRAIADEPGASTTGYASASLLSQALADLTGGVPIERYMFDAAGQEWCARRERDGLWSRLLESHGEKCVIAVRCCPAQPRAAEKCARMGLHMNRLYPVLEATEAEGVRLVLLHNPWAWEANVTTWRGKWALRAADAIGGAGDGDAVTWTDARRMAFDTASRPANSFWVSYDELQHYFGVVHYVDLKCPVSRINCQIASGGPPESVEWRCNAQYSVNFTGSNSVVVESPRKSSERVIVGLHDVDQRLAINRALNATVDYRQRAALRLVVLQVTQNERRITELASEAVVLSTRGERKRDQYFAFDAVQGAKYVVMPCFDVAVSQESVPPPPQLQCALSLCRVDAIGATAATFTQVEDDRTVSIDGEWVGATAGGPHDYAEWRSNPQYLLYPSEDMTVTIVLRQRNATQSSVDHIGFVVLDSLHAGARIMKFETSQVVARATHANSSAVSVCVALRSVSHRRGMPYVVVPSTAKPGVETGFSLCAIGNRPMQLKRLQSEFDWKVVRLADQKIAVADGSAGGATKFSSWRNNPQYCCRFPVGKSGRLVVTMIKRGASTLSKEQIGLVCFYGEDFQGGRRKRLTYRAEDIAAIGSSTSGESAEIDIPFDGCSKLLLVMPYSELPFTDVNFTLTFHCTVDVDVERAIEWHQYQQESAWVAGSTAGGPRHTHGWVNNPFYRINVSRPTRVFALVMQYPHGPEKLVARKVGRQRVFIAPPIVNDHLAVDFAVDLCDTSESTLPVVACSMPTRLAETSVTALLEPFTDNDRAQHLLVPHTSAAGIEADFKIIVYSDHPVDFSMLPPADPYRGRSFN